MNTFRIEFQSSFFCSVKSSGLETLVQSLVYFILVYVTRYSLFIFLCVSIYFSLLESIQMFYIYTVAVKIIHLPDKFFLCPLYLNSYMSSKSPVFAILQHIVSSIYTENFRSIHRGIDKKKTDLLHKLFIWAIRSYLKLFL